MSTSKRDESKPTARSSEPAASSNEADELRKNIERTRGQMSGTIEALQEQLNPTVLKGKLKEELSEVKEAVKGELAEAKEAVKHELIEAKDAFKEEVAEQYEHAKDVAYDATIGRVENMARSAGETMNEVRMGVMDTIRQNPIPAALTGIGLAWLLMNRRSTVQNRWVDESNYGRGRVRFDGSVVDPYGMPMGYRGQPQSRGAIAQVGQQVGQYAQRAQHVAGEAVHSVTDKAGEVAGRARHEVEHLAGEAGRLAHRVTDEAGNLVHSAQDQAGQLVHYAQDQATHLAQSARSTARRAEYTVQHAFQENPLAVGAVALALGTAVGLALPRTTIEDNIMGEARDNLLEQAEAVAHDALGKAQEVAGTVQHTAEQLAGVASAVAGNGESSSTSNNDTAGAKRGNGNQGQGASSSTGRSMS